MPFSPDSDHRYSSFCSSAASVASKPQHLDTAKEELMGRRPGKLVLDGLADFGQCFIIIHHSLNNLPSDSFFLRLLAFSIGLLDWSTTLLFPPLRVKSSNPSTGLPYSILNRYVWAPCFISSIKDIRKY